MQHEILIRLYNKVSMLIKNLSNCMNLIGIKGFKIFIWWLSSFKNVVSQKKDIRKMVTSQTEVTWFVTYYVTKA